MKMESGVVFPKKNGAEVKGVSGYASVDRAAGSEFTPLTRTPPNLGNFTDLPHHRRPPTAFPPTFQLPTPIQFLPLFSLNLLPPCVTVNYRTHPPLRLARRFLRVENLPYVAT